MTGNMAKTSRFNDFILLSFFPVVMIYMLLQFMGYRLPILGIYVRLALLYSVLLSIRHAGRNIVSTFLVIYILYCLLSLVFVTDSDVKLSGYSYDLLNFILPMSAFFIGSNKIITDNRYYNWFLYSVLFCFGLGLFFYFFSTNWYVEKISVLSYDRLGTELSDLDELHERTRFSSFMYGPYPIQYLGIPALSYLLFQIYSDKDKYRKDKWYYAISVIVIIVSIVLCQQRTAWGYLAVLIIFYLVISLGKKKDIWGLLIFGVVIFAIISFVQPNFDVIGSVLGSRMDEMSFSSAMSGRTNQYESLWENWTRPIFGHGMGSGGAIARVAGLPGASDAGYMKILYENGMVGSLLFLGIIIPTLVRVIKKRKYYYVELHIIIFFLIAMLGSNALCISLYYSIMFWYAIGRVWNSNYLNEQSLKQQ